MLDFLGTFNRSQFDRFVAYVKGQLAYAQGKIRHLAAEKERVGFLQFSYDTAGRPQAYSTGTPGTVTYIGKLLKAYEVNGGDPFYDLQVRSKADPIFFQKGDDLATAKILSNGEPLPQPGLVDARSGDLVRRMREWTSGSIDRLNQLERKIRRSVDYSDQLQDEIDTLNKVIGTVDQDGSLLNLEQQVRLLLADPSYRAIYDDQGKDPFGKLTHAPMTSYEPGANRGSTSGLAVERTNQGAVVVGNNKGSGL